MKPTQSHRIPRLTAAARVGLLTLRVNPLRTILSTLGVIMGVASVVGVLSIGDGVAAFARDQVARTTDLQMVSVVPRTTQRLDGILVRRADVARFTPADVPAIQHAAPEARSVSLVRSGGTIARRTAASPPRGLIVTAVASAAAATPPPLLAGSLLGDEDLAGERHIVVLSASAAESLAVGQPPAALVGDSILLRDAAFVVRGILAPRSHERAEAIVPWRAADAALGASDGPSPVPVLTLVAGNLDSVTAMIRHVEAWAGGRFGRDWKERIDVQANTARLEQTAQAMLVFKLLMGAITGISLVVGGIGIMNVLLAAVAERTREIGIRKAVGARRRDVIVQFLSESLAITGAGGAIGLVLGFIVAVATAAVMRARTGAQVNAAIGLSTLLVALGASVGVGLAFGLYPALRAGRLSPVDAIRHE